MPPFECPYNISSCMKNSAGSITNGKQTDNNDELQWRKDIPSLVLELSSIVIHRTKLMSDQDQDHDHNNPHSLTPYASGN